VHRRGCGHPAAVARNLMHHDRRFRHAESRTAVLLRHGDAEPPALGHRFAGKAAILVALQPVFVVEPADDRANARADRIALVLARQWSCFAHAACSLSFSDRSQRLLRRLQMRDVDHFAVDANRSGVRKGAERFDDAAGMRYLGFRGRVTTGLIVPTWS
jgi:hypothetical protein